nr:glycerophosphodiester phosphodiesterase [Arthrobacter sp. ISL-30]
MSLPLPYFRRPDGRPGPLALAHRGFSLDGLENTTAAFRAAVELGFSHLETDVHTSADGVVFLFHDETLDRVTDSTGRINELTAEQLARARVGGNEPLPRLQDVLRDLPDARLNLDVKDWNSVRATAGVIESTAVHDRVLVTSFSDRRRRAVLRLLSRRTASSAGVACTVLFTMLGPVLPAGLLRFLLRDVDAFQVPARYGVVPVVTPAFVRRAHRLGILVHVWTVNDPAEMHRLLDLGVDGIVTDRADLLKEVFQVRGVWG